ncbi:MAG: hypothetical protein EZS28_017073 [Streblomastix strix]|uniref:Uncharacterized protein n=1 Tax=Streblomastix strix TaxID=222440 RepID=A0A5J4VXF8_9EUKA|nr:MAG: hypothetical protein EZS28_017073 [Streblomastix strix]
MESKMKKKNLKVSQGRILALEVNGDKMEQDYFEMLQKHPDYQEMQLDRQQITGMEVEDDTSARYQPFGTEYITDKIKNQSDAFVIQARTSVSTMFELIRRQEKDIRKKVIKQLNLKPVSNTRKIIREVTIWKMQQLLDYILKLGA